LRKLSRTTSLGRCWRRPPAAASRAPSTHVWHECVTVAKQREFIVADEPVAALDVTIQAQILDLRDRLKRSYRFTYVLISHDLRVVEQIADRVAIPILR
jgi:ABC-type antimicrobial peptide transport system ATPase subunit